MTDIKKKKPAPTSITMKELRQLIREAIREQISGMGMGSNAGRGRGYMPGLSNPNPGPKFDMLEDLKKAKDPATPMDELMALAKHQNEQVSAAAKQSISDKLFKIGGKVEF